MRILEAIRTNKEIIDAKTFLELKEKSPHMIKSARIVPEKIGSGKIEGNFEVVYSQSIYKTRMVNIDECA